MGLLEAGPAGIAARYRAAWAGFLDVAHSADLGAPSRLAGWTGHDVLVHLGVWSAEEAVSGIVQSARGVEVDPATMNADRTNARLIAEHAGASREEVLAALGRHRDAVLAWLATDEPTTIGRRTALSPIGPMPLLTVVGAAAYELAVHALDLLPCGARRPAPQLLLAGLGAVLDVTGCLAVRRGLSATVHATAPDGGWRLAAEPDGWTVEPVPAGDPPKGTGVTGDLDVLVDATAGRRHVPGLLAARKIVAHDLAGFLRLAAVVEDVPGLPGGPALKAAARTLGAAGRVVSFIRRP
jgi:uncharacterized protein (TIGR03083 family)